MLINGSPNSSEVYVESDAGYRLYDDDRYCHHCREVALVFDPAAKRARCRSCGELA